MGQIVELWVGDSKVASLLNPGWAWKPLVLSMGDTEIVVPRRKPFSLGAAHLAWSWFKIVIETEADISSQEFLVPLLVGYYLWSLEDTSP